MLEVLRSDRFADKAPAQVRATLWHHQLGVSLAHSLASDPNRFLRAFDAFVVHRGIGDPVSLLIR